MKLKLTVGISLLLCAPAVAQDVYPGCEVPTTVAGRHTFFVDPVKGSDKGDGSMAKPWKSLNTVLSPVSRLISTRSHKTPSGSPLLPVNPTAPIKGGDIIMLMSGDYGDVTLLNTFNDKFITIMSAPGQKPVIQHLKVAGAARWVFQNLTFQSEYPSGSARNANKMVFVADGWDETTKNIIFDADTFQSTGDTTGWTARDWYSRPNLFALGMRGTCGAVTNSTFVNIWNGIEEFGPKTLIANNTFDRFSNDAIDVNSSNVQIKSNTIKNAMNNSLNDQHPDAIQGWSPTVAGKMVANSNVIIDGNKIYNPVGSDGNYLQGINLGTYNNVAIQNNVIVTNHWIGIIIGGLQDSRVINNTVMPSDPVAHPTWILVNPSQEKRPSLRVVVRNNVAYQIRAEDQSITMDHNANVLGYSTFSNQKAVFHKVSDTSTQNTVSPMVAAAFREWDPTRDSFNLHLKSGSMLDSKGSASLAPLTDADGRSRSTPVDLGAYTR